MGKTEKNLERKNHATKVTKIPKTKRRKYGMKETVMYILNQWLFVLLSNQVWYFFFTITLKIKYIKPESKSCRSSCFSDIISSLRIEKAI